MSEEVCFAAAVELVGKIRARELSPVEVVDAFLGCLERRIPEINAYVTVIGARAEAVEAERALLRELLSGAGAFEETDGGEGRGSGSGPGTRPPAASVPADLTRIGLPVGMQIIGRRFADETVISASAAFERARPWHNTRPPGS